MQTLVLDATEPFSALRERLLADRGHERIALLAPANQRLAKPDLLLMLLRRLADREHLALGLVSDDRALRQQAAALGLPAFATLQAAEHHNHTWHLVDRREQVGFAWAEPRQGPEGA